MSKLKYFDGTNWNEVNGNIVGDTLPIGAIVPYGSTTAPTGWLVCDGSAVSRTTYSELFAVIGTSFGAGDGSTTFNLPNLKGKVPVGYNSSDSDFDSIGETGGSKTHRHDYKIGLFDNNYSPTGGFAGMSAYNETKRGGAYKYSTNEWGGASGTGISKTQLAGKTSTAENTATELMASQGDTDTASSLQPYLTVRFIIKAKQSAGVVAQVETSASNSNTNVYSCKYVNDTLSNLIKIKEVAGTTDGNGFLNLNMNLNQYIVLGVRVKIGQDSFANPYNIRGIDGWSVQLKTWDGQNIGSTQFTLEVVYIET